MFRPAAAGRRFRALLTLTAATAMLGACTTTDRLSELGKAPAFAAIENPERARDYQPVSMPMPAPELQSSQANSLWRTGARAFFKDQRAGQVGDILTINIQINDRAQLQNQTTRTRDNSENMGIPGLFGLQRGIARVLPTADDDTLENLVQTTSDSSSTGTGSIARNEQINLRVAALITQTLPNGNLVVQGRQQIRVNHELRDLMITGIIRPEDITSQNTINYDQIAEARIAYGGRGTITEVQQPRWGQQVLDVIAPF